MHMSGPGCSDGCFPRRELKEISRIIIFPTLNPSSSYIFIVWVEINSVIVCGRLQSFRANVCFLPLFMLARRRLLEKTPLRRAIFVRMDHYYHSNEWINDTMSALEIMRVSEWTKMASLKVPRSSLLEARLRVDAPPPSFSSRVESKRWRRPQLPRAPNFRRKFPELYNVTQTYEYVSHHATIITGCWM